MTEETCKDGLQVARLDRRQPPGYRLFKPGDGLSWSWHTATAREDGHCGIGEALAAAWAHYERGHDPPGMQAHAVDGGFLVQVFDHPAGEIPQNHTGPTFEPLPALVDARAAAWAWYWRRLELVRTADAKGWAAPGDPLDPWPAALTWSDEQVAEVIRWLGGRCELPEVLRA